MIEKYLFNGNNNNNQSMENLFDGNFDNDDTMNDNDETIDNKETIEIDENFDDTVGL